MMLSVCSKVRLPGRTLCSFRSGNLREYSSLFPKSHSLRGEKNRQFLTPDQGTIVCVHPAVPADISGTKVHENEPFKLMAFNFICFYLAPFCTKT